MAWVIKGTSLGKLLNVSLNQSGVLNNSLRGACIPQIFAIQTANISGKALRDKARKRPPPYPYKSKTYGFWNALFDKTTWRFDDNSKIIVVEGPIGVGKTTFAKALADDLEMLHLPECNMDMKYINDYGFDIRQLDPQLPESCQSFDIQKFYDNPNHQNVASFQIEMYRLRYEQYLDALSHLLSTGQGVVMERCAFSDFVFLEAMHKAGYISRGARSVYYDISKNTIPELLRPHLVIYLDIPVKKVQERIKKRNIPYEVNSKVLTPKYLSDVEEFYKLRFLKEISQHSELLVYDWSDFGDVEVVIEDIERIDFDQYDKYELKLRDWRLADEWAWCELRQKYTKGRHFLMNNFLVPRLDVPELLIPAGDIVQRDLVYSQTPSMKHSRGFNADAGDTGLLFKDKEPPKEQLHS
ncbi:hypothetical protein R5R35_012313 [Gryllus longicercus]|uniref:NADH dehydrogenase [ubiquinone] 1 alpha subcomplex subunit 10, mitochondrial n=1 Tax=Gryllus longicercus TaxID=2509291 RepID=A0AAN9VI45_9ORTH